MNKLLKFLKCDISWLPFYKEIFGCFVMWILLIPSFSCAEPNFYIPAMRSSLNSTTIWSSNYWASIFNSYSNRVIDLVAWTQFCISSVSASNYFRDYSYSLYNCSSSPTLSSDFSSNSSCHLLYTFSNVIQNTSSNYSVVLSSDMACFWIDSTNPYYFIVRDWVWVSSNFMYWITYINYNVLQSYFQSWYILPSECPSSSCPTCPNQYTSLECQTEYNLIPIENVTENYCTSNFNLISPSDCPVSWWTWDINWSSVWINNQQVVWSPNIFLNIYDKLDWSQTYVNQDMYIDVNGPEGDEEYINWIIGINTYRPTSEDFTTVFVSGLTLLFPYIVITLFVLFIRKLIRKIFK